MIDHTELLLLHESLNQQFWGAPGIRDPAALESALARPLATFDGKDLYDTPLQKIAALTESLVVNHPFVEGNMRTAYVLMRMLLLEQGLDVEATEQERLQLMLDIATAKAGYQEIIDWLHLHMG